MISSSSPDLDVASQPKQMARSYSSFRLSEKILPVSVSKRTEKDAFFSTVNAVFFFFFFFWTHLKERHVNHKYTFSTSWPILSISPETNLLSFSKGTKELILISENDKSLFFPKILTTNVFFVYYCFIYTYSADHFQIDLLMFFLQVMASSIFTRSPQKMHSSLFGRSLSLFLFQREQRKSCS